MDLPVKGTNDHFVSTLFLSMGYRAGLSQAAERCRLRPPGFTTVCHFQPVSFDGLDRKVSTFL
jgi:hypothetical protein